MALGIPFSVGLALHPIIQAIRQQLFKVASRTRVPPAAPSPLLAVRYSYNQSYCVRSFQKVYMHPLYAVFTPLSATNQPITSCEVSTGVMRSVTSYCRKLGIYPCPHNFLGSHHSYVYATNPFLHTASAYIYVVIDFEKFTYLGAVTSYSRKLPRVL